MIDTVAPDRAKHSRCRGIRVIGGIGFALRLVVCVGGIIKKIAKTLKLVEDHQIGSDLLKRGNRECASHRRNQPQAVARVEERTNSRREMLTGLEPQLDAQRLAECRAERAIGDFPVPDRVSKMANPAPEALWPHIHAKGAVKPGNCSWQDLVQQGKAERPFLDAPLASPPPSRWQCGVGCEREDLNRAVRGRFAGGHQARSIDFRNRAFAFVVPAGRKRGVRDSVSRSRGWSTRRRRGAALSALPKCAR